jgi:sulfur transfer complex TusBCD TusB component (DsrH family)/MoxR-like ATPase/cell division protein FtsL
MSRLKNPFVGLRPFESEDSLYYFGRREQTGELLTYLHRSHLVAVVGSSGCGKSSLVRAGLIPNLEAGFLVQDRDSWHIARMKPGYRPIYHLAEALLHAVPGVPAVGEKDSAAEVTALADDLMARGFRAVLERFGKVLEEKESNLFLLVDQFEEVFRFGLNSGDRAKRGEAADFVDLLLQMAEQKEMPVYVCLTMRSDYIGDCDAFHGLPEAMNRSQYLVPRLTRAQRRQAIEGPIRLAGAAVAPRLVDRLLNESGEYRDDLPVLQHALMRTWELWQKQGGSADVPLDTVHYEGIYTMKQALSRHADEAMEELTEADRQLAKSLFQALTEIDAENRRIRRSMHLNDIAAVTGAKPERLMDVIDTFRRVGRAFLVLPAGSPEDNPLVELAHESLMRQWETLGQWMEEEADSADVYRRLADAAALKERGKGGLYIDPALQLAQEWRENQRPTPAWGHRYHVGFENAMAFLEESRAARDEKKREEEKQREERERLLQEKARHQQKALRLTRLIIVVIIAAIIIAACLTYLALKSKEETLKSQEETLKSQEQTQKSLKEAIKSKLETQKILEKAIKSNVELQMIYEEAIKIKKEASYNLARLFDEMAMKALASGQKINDTGSCKDAWLYMTAALRQEIDSQKLHLRPESEGVLLTTGVVNAAFQERLVSPTVIAHSDRLTAVTFSPEGQTIASVSANMTIHLWDRDLQKEIATLTGHSNWVNCVAFSPDGKTIASGSEDKTIRLWDRDSQKEIATLTGNTDAVTCVAFSPNGDTIVSGSRDQNIRLWDSATKKEIAILPGHRGPVTCVAFSPDGNTIASGSGDMTIRLWDLRIFNLFLKGGKPTPLFLTFAEGVEFFWGVRLVGFEYKRVGIPEKYDEKFRPLLDEPAPGQTKFEQILQWAKKQVKEK